MKTLGNILDGWVRYTLIRTRLISKLVILTISMIMTMSMTNLANAAGAIYIGGSIPTGDQVTDQYGDLWLDLGAKYSFAQNGNLSHSAFFDYFRGSQSYSFITSNGIQATSTAQTSTVSLGYEILLNPESESYYFGGGLALGVVSNETEYDAGSGRFWVINGDQIYTAVGDKQTKLIPHLVGGYRFGERSAIEIKYRFIGAKLSATDSAFAPFYPTAITSKLDDLLTVAYVYRY